MKICRGYAQVAAPGGVGSCESRHCSTVSSFHIRLSLVCPKKSRIFIGANFDFLDLSASVDVGVFDSAVLKTPLSPQPLHEKLPDQNFCRRIWGIQSAWLPLVLWQMIWLLSQPSGSSPQDFSCRWCLCLFRGGRKDIIHTTKRK